MPTEFDTEGVVHDVIGPNDTFGVEIPLPHVPGVSGEAPSTPGCENDAVGVENQIGANRHLLSVHTSGQPAGNPAAI